jgi:hypothetical protein
MHALLEHALDTLPYTQYDIHTANQHQLVNAVVQDTVELLLVNLAPTSSTNAFTQLAVQQLTPLPTIAHIIPSAKYCKLPKRNIKLFKSVMLADISSVDANKVAQQIDAVRKEYARQEQSLSDWEEFVHRMVYICEECSEADVAEILGRFKGLRIVTARGVFDGVRA